MDNVTVTKQKIYYFHWNIKEQTAYILNIYVYLSCRNVDYTHREHSHI